MKNNHQQNLISIGRGKEREWKIVTITILMNTKLSSWSVSLVQIPYMVVLEKLQEEWRKENFSREVTLKAPSKHDVSGHHHDLLLVSSNPLFVVHCLHISFLFLPNTIQSHRMFDGCVIIITFSRTHFTNVNSRNDLTSLHTTIANYYKVGRQLKVRKEVWYALWWIKNEGEKGKSLIKPSLTCINTLHRPSTISLYEKKEKN